MPFPIMAALGAAAPFVGMGLSYLGQQQTNEANALEAARNREFQKYMRGTQYQVAVKDMQRAGLNPALAYQQGGAGNLSGNVATMSNPWDGAANSAAQAAQIALQNKQVAAQVANVDAQTSLLKAEGVTKMAMLKAQLDNIRQTTATSFAQQGATRRQEQLFLAQEGKTNVEANQAERNLQLFDQTFNLQKLQVLLNTLATRASTREANARSALTEAARPRAEVFSMPFEFILGKVLPWITGSAKDINPFKEKK